jgi:hypothetical protein
MMAEEEDDDIPLCYHLPQEASIKKIFSRQTPQLTLTTDQRQEAEEASNRPAPLHGDRG